MTSAKITIVTRPTSKKSENVVVYLRIRVKNSMESLRTIEISTGLVMAAKQWDKKKQVAKGSSDMSRAYNYQITQLKANAYSTFTQVNAQEPFDFNRLKILLGNKKLKDGTIKEILPLFDAAINKKQSQVSESRIKRYNRVRNILSDFLNDKYGRTNVELNEFNSSMYDDFKSYMKANIRTVGCSTREIYLKVLKAVANKSCEIEYLQKNPFKYCKSEKDKSEVQYWTDKEFFKLTTIPDEKLTERQIKIRDQALFQGLTGIAYTDMKNLTYNDIVETDNGKMIIKCRQKTNIKYKIPINESIEEIIEKYRNEPKQNAQSLFAVPCLNDYNRDLNVLRILVGVNKPLRSHILRHTFATMYIRGGGSLYTLSKILGHSTVRETAKYGKLQNEGIIEEANEVSRKLEVLNKLNKISRNNKDEGDEFRTSLSE